MILHGLNGKDLEIFLSIAMGQSISRAAALLGLTQSAVSRRLFSLEKAIGSVLVNRQKGVKSISLTEAGESLIPLALKWQELQNSLVMAKEAAPSYYLTIGAVDSVNVCVLPPLISLLNEQRVRVNMRTHKPGDLYQRVESRELDVAFVPIEQHSQHVQVIPFYRDRLLVAFSARSGHGEEQVRATDLKPADELRISWGREFDLWHNHLWPQHFSSIQVDSVSMVATLLRGENQWAIVPESSVPVLEQVGIHFRELNPTPPECLYYMVMHRYPKTSAQTPLKLLAKSMHTLFPWCTY